MRLCRIDPTHTNGAKMASIGKDRNGTKRILLECPDGKRRTIRLGKVSMEAAREAKRNIESIAAAKWGQVALTLDQLKWLNGLTDTVYERIQKTGIIEPRETTKSKAPSTLFDFIQHYIEGRTDLKPSTREQYGYTRRLLVEYFGRDRLVDSVTRSDAKAWQRWMRLYEWKPATDSAPAETLAPATVSKHTKRAKTIFTEAVDARLIAENPMDAIKGGEEVNRERDFFIDRQMADTIVESIANVRYRLAFALARWGGLRCCEITRLRWSDMIWDTERMRVNSPKTGLRFVPMFPELRPHLDDAFDAAPSGDRRIIDCVGENANLGPQMKRFVEKAGIVPWAKPMQNLRASRRTELEQQFPAHVIESWMGHSEKVSRKHYLQVTPEHWETATKTACPNNNKTDTKAAQKAAQ